MYKNITIPIICALAGSFFMSAFPVAFATNGEQSPIKKEAIKSAEDEAMETELKKIAQETGKKTLAKQDVQEEEEPTLFLLDDLTISLSDAWAQIVMTGDEGVPEGKILSDESGRFFRWHPQTPTIMKQRKKIIYEAGLIRSVQIKEDPEKSREMKLEAPYYALDYIEIAFLVEVNVKERRTEAGVTIEFSAAEKGEKKKESEVKKEEVQPEPKAIDVSSMSGILGDAYKANESYAAYMVGGKSIADPVALFRSPQAYGAARVPSDFFYGTQGFPEDISVAFKEERPTFGTPDYWKKHLSAIISNDIGYTTDFDGTIGASASTLATKDSAWGWNPNVLVSYARPGTVDFSANYAAARLCPIGSKFISFEDGIRNQRVSWGVSHFPNKRYSIGYQNYLDYNTSTQLRKSDEDGTISRVAHDAKNTMHALGLNYRLARRLAAGVGVGMSRTRSRDEDNKSRDRIGGITGSLEYVLNEKTSIVPMYSFQHIFEDKSDTDTASDLKTKITDIHILNFDYQQKIAEKISINGGPKAIFVGKTQQKFGGDIAGQYQLFPDDIISFSYSNDIVQDNILKTYGWSTSAQIGNVSTSISLKRREFIDLVYTHQFGYAAQKTPRYILKVSGSYQKLQSISGIDGGGGSVDDGISFEASINRQIGRGAMFLQLGYRFVNYHSKGVDPDDSLDASTKKHLFFLTITNYLGK